MNTKLSETAAASGIQEAWILLPSVCGLGALVVGARVIWPVEPAALALQAILTCAWVVFLRLPVLAPSGRYVAMASGLGIATGGLLDPLSAVMTVALGAGIGRLGSSGKRARRREVLLLGLLATTLSLATAAANRVFVDTTSAKALLLMGVVFFTGDLLLMALPEREEAGSLAGARWQEAVPASAAQVSIGLAVLVQQPVFGIVGTLTLLLLMLISRHVFGLRFQLRAAHFDTIRALMHLVEMRGGCSPGHAGRVARTSARIAQAAGLQASEVENLMLAAMVHEIGSLCAEREDSSEPCGCIAEESVQVLAGSAFLAKLTPIVASAGSRRRGYSLPGEILRFACLADRQAPSALDGGAAGWRALLEVESGTWSAALRRAVRLAAREGLAG